MKDLCLLLVCLFIVPQLKSFSQNYDVKLLRSINSKESAFKNNFFKIDAKAVTVINIAAPVGLFTSGIITHNKKLQIDAVFMAGSFIASSAITHSVKKIMKHSRPCDVYGDIVKRGSGGGYSFPSGHTSAAFSTATSLSLAFPKWYVIAPGYLWASSVAYGRMYQGVHYPSDVLIGAFVGAGTAVLGWKLERLMLRKTGKLKITLK